MQQLYGSRASLSRTLSYRAVTSAQGVPDKMKSIGSGLSAFGKKVVLGGSDSVGQTFDIGAEPQPSPATEHDFGEASTSDNKVSAGWGPMPTDATTAGD